MADQQTPEVSIEAGSSLQGGLKDTDRHSIEKGVQPLLNRRE